MSAAPRVFDDPQGRPVLTIEKVAALRAELSKTDITPERRSEIRSTLSLAKERQEVSFSLGFGMDTPVANLCRDVLNEDIQREQDARDRAREDARRARVEAHRQHVAERPARFAALPKMRQALLYTEGRATDARAGWRAYGEAQALQEAGEPIPVPWTFETELLSAGELRSFARQGLIDADECERLVNEIGTRDRLL